jgi:hypothetical protein
MINAEKLGWLKNVIKMKNKAVAQGITGTTLAKNLKF